MKAVRLYKKGDLRVENIPRPEDPKPDEMLLKVEAAGICGSDLHNYHTGMWISRSPSTPGHEFVATVIDIGSQVNTFVPGDRVVADSRVPCGSCGACKRGDLYLCTGMGFVGELNDGGFAAYTIQKSTQMLKLPDQSIDAKIAVLTEPLAVALHAVNRVVPNSGDSAVVMGAGTIGVLSAIVLRHRGVSNITIVDTNEIRRALVCDAFGFTAHEAGAVVHPTVCIDTTGAPAALSSALGMVARGGRISVVGLYGVPLEIDMNTVVEGGITIYGCAAFDHELSEAILLISELEGELQKLSTTTIDVESVPEWYVKLNSKDNHVQKAIVLHDSE